MNENWALTELPKGWLWTDFESISRELKAGGTPLTKTKEYYNDGNIPFVKIEDIVGSGKYLYDTKTRITEQGLKNSSAWLVPRDSLLYSMYASYGEPIVNKIEVATSQAIIAYIPPQGLIVLDYVYYYLKKIRTELTTRGTTQKNLNAQIVKHIPIPLAPFNEQVHIVAKLERLFTSLDVGVEGLRKVKAQLKRYRQAVLKYAFEGKLTEEWRKTHKDQIEPATKLLEKIKQERKEKLGTKYKELPPLDASELPNLPESWMWIRLGEISERMQYGTSEKANTESLGIPVLRMGNIQEGKIVFDYLKYFHEDWSQLNEFLLNDGDVLFNRTNSAELVGKTAVYREHHPKSVFASYLIRVQTDKTVYIPEVLSFFINSFYGRKYISSVVSQQVGQANVNGTKLSLMPVPLIQCQEQIVIQQEIERCFSIADEMEEATEQSLKQAEFLRQSILKIAFEGKLVPQDPSDEPAEKLLERIKTEGAKSKGEKDIKKGRISRNS